MDQPTDRLKKVIKLLNIKKLIYKDILHNFHVFEFLIKKN
jgi:hypothetical protein